MSVEEWSFVIIWPVVVVVFNNFLAHQQLKHLANVTCENFRKSGEVLASCLGSIRRIEEALGEHGIKIAHSDQSRRGEDLARIAR